MSVVREQDVGEFTVVMDGSFGTGWVVAIHHPWRKTVTHKYDSCQFDHALDRFNDIIERMALMIARQALGLKP